MFESAIRINLFWISRLFSKSIKQQILNKNDLLIQNDDLLYKYFLLPLTLLFSNNVQFKHIHFIRTKLITFEMFHHVVINTWDPIYVYSSIYLLSMLKSSFDKPFNFKVQILIICTTDYHLRFLIKFNLLSNIQYLSLFSFL